MLKTLKAQIGEFARDSILTPLCMIGEVIMEMIIPLMMASIIDDGVEKGDIHHIYVVGAWMILAAALGLFFGVMGGRFGARAATGFARNLRRAMYRNIQTFSFSNIDKYSTAGLVTRLTTDVTNLQNAYQMILRMCTRAPVSLIVAMCMAFSISPRLASIYLVAVVVLGICLVFIMSRTFGYFQETFRKYDDLNASVQENVLAIRVVKAYVREDYENEKFKRASGRLRDLFMKAEKILTLNMPLMQLTVYGCILFISWFGAQMIVVGDLTTGNLMSLLNYCMNILMSLMMLSMVFVMITMSRASARRIVEVLNERSDLADGEDPLTQVKDGGIDFEHVSFAYKRGGEEVLTGIDLHIRPGETVGIVGGTGSSKSSLVQLIPRLYDVTEGCVKVGGEDVRRYDLEALRNSVAMVLQKNELFSGSIKENMRWGNPAATDEEIREACRLAQADDFIQAMPDGYDTHIEQGGSNVSGGQKQRLCIARALLKKPKILLLDDSTSAVDTATDSRIRQAFAQKIPGTTKIIIAQRISSVQDADHILVLDDGKVNGWGTHEELLANNEIYREVYMSQTQGGGDFDQKGED